MVTVYSPKRGATEVLESPEDVSRKYRIPLGYVLRALRDGTRYKSLTITWSDGTESGGAWKAMKGYRRCDCCRNCLHSSNFEKGSLRCTLAEVETGSPVYILPGSVCSLHVHK